MNGAEGFSRRQKSELVPPWGLVGGVGVGSTLEVGVGGAILRSGATSGETGGVGNGAGIS